MNSFITTSPEEDFIQFSAGDSFIEVSPGDSFISAQPEDIFRKPCPGAGGDLCSVYSSRRKIMTDRPCSTTWLQQPSTIDMCGKT